MQYRKMTYQIAGVENAGLENDGTNRGSGQETQLSQRGRATLHVAGDFAKCLKITRGHSKLHSTSASVRL